MVRSSDITLISSSQTLSLATDIYLVNASNSTTITLPLILCNGTNYKLIREDISSNIVTIQPTKPNLIIYNLGINGKSATTGNINLQLETIVSVESYNNNWYIIGNTSTVRNNNIIFSSLFTNNTVPYISCSKTTRSSIGTFTYLGYGVQPITQVIFTIAPNTSSVSTGTLDIRNLSNNSVIASSSYSFSNKTITSVIITTIKNLPITVAIFDIGIVTNGKALNIYSVIVK